MSEHLSNYSSLRDQSIALMQNTCTPPKKRNSNSNQGFHRRKRRKNSAILAPASPAFPPHCKVYKSNKPSSRRTQCGASAEVVSHIVSSTRARQNRRRRSNQKLRKQGMKLIPCAAPKNLDLCWSQEDINNAHLVIDGGRKGQPLLAPTEDLPDKRPWKALRIALGDLSVADTKNPEKGIFYPPPPGQSMPFLRLPRTDALNLLGLGSHNKHTSFMNALDKIASVQKGTLFRSTRKVIYSDDKYCVVGSQVCRASRGIRDHTYHKDKVSVSTWDTLWDYMLNIETAFASFVNTQEIRQINAARNCLDVKTMACADSSRRSRVFGGIAFGVNVHLDCHTDDDYVRSVTTVHVKKEKYHLIDDIVVYFGFPRLGYAVALRPGDVLIFNPSEPHAVSSRCRLEDTIYCISFYLKSAVVGGNDNSIPLSDVQEAFRDFGTTTLRQHKSSLETPNSCT